MISPTGSSRVTPLASPRSEGSSEEDSTQAVFVRTISGAPALSIEIAGSSLEALQELQTQISARVRLANDLIIAEAFDKGQDAVLQLLGRSNINFASSDHYLFKNACREGWHQVISTLLDKLEMPVELLNDCLYKAAICGKEGSGQVVSILLSKEGGCNSIS